MATRTRRTRSQSADEGSRKGRALLMAVERIVDSPAKIRARAAEVEARIREALPDGAPDDQVRKAVEQRLIADYSNRTALAGGAAALPGIVPGIGSLTTLIGGGLVDMTFCLKYEVEMVLALAALRGYNIENARERQLAYLMAAAHTYEASSGENPLGDLLKTEADAVWNFTPRQLGKLVASLFVKLALWFAGKGFARALPLVGVVVSTAANKTLTMRVGKSVIVELDRRSVVAPPGARPQRRTQRKAAAARPRAAAKERRTARAVR